MSKLHISSTPHIHQKGSTTRNVMLDVVIAMLPAAVAAVVLFGLQALLIIAACVIPAVAAEFLFNLVTKRKQTIGDLSAVVTGLLLALNLSVTVPLWQCAVGSMFAIVVVKCLFGGLGRNIVNPAIAARVMMLLCFSAVAGGALPKPELVAGATPLEQFGTDAAPSLMTLLVGNHGGTIGETCAIALILGFAYLVLRKVIRWYVPVTFAATVFVCYLAATGSVADAAYQLLAGGLLLGAIFMATDYVTTPITDLGRVFFALGCGLITFAIRYWGSYPEGVSIAILCMNLTVPFLEKWTTKKPLGGV